MSKTIPKIIHYCWVGGAPKPESVLYCIESWEKYCPDYEIKEWNEDNYDFTKNKYMKQAYEAKKWGFVPDYARLDIIYEYGGIYLDTDVELVKSFDELLEYDAFMGFENTGDGEFFVNCGHGFGAKPYNSIIKDARDLYDSIAFINADGSYNMVPSPYYTTQTLRQHGLEQNNQDQILNTMKVFSSDVLCPKNFRTGKISLTERSVSIHHFTATWLDEKIKVELNHQQRIKKVFGKKLGLYVLLVESVLEKYSIKELFTKLPLRLMMKTKRKMIIFIESIPYIVGLIQGMVFRNNTKSIAIFDTAIDSDNTGDQIIMENCLNQLSAIMSIKAIPYYPTHRALKADEKKSLDKIGKKIVCGTNILSGHMKSYGLWKLDADTRPYKNTILMGVGFDSNSKDFDWYSKALFKCILSKKGIHSVRDSFAEKKLKEMGIKNVLNTGCPTMWNLTSEHCSKIPRKKGRDVVCTVTDYSQDPQNDKEMIKILAKYYEKVYLWIQGENDREYIKKLGISELIEIGPEGLVNYDRILGCKDLDYVGTRLHAGIRALSYGHRSLIISIDNRAECIAADTNLPILKREDVVPYLNDKIISDYSIDIKLHEENIKKWKKQFINTASSIYKE